MKYLFILLLGGCALHLGSTSSGKAESETVYPMSVSPYVYDTTQSLSLSSARSTSINYLGKDGKEVLKITDEGEVFLNGSKIGTDREIFISMQKIMVGRCSN